MISFDRPIAYHREFVQFGGVKAAVFLSQAFFWHYRTKDKDGWFYKTADEWEEETGLTRREQESARKSLRSLGIIEEVKKGVPCRIFYKINEAKLENLLQQNSQSSFDESAKLESTKAPTLIKTETTTETTTEIKRNIKEKDFDKFWEVYPKKVAKKKAESAYRNSKTIPGIEAHIKIKARRDGTTNCR